MDGVLCGVAHLHGCSVWCDLLESMDDVCGVAYLIAWLKESSVFAIKRNCM